MLVMFGSNAVLILGLVPGDVATLTAGGALEYADPPHDAQLVKHILVVHGTDPADVVRQVQGAGFLLEPEMVARYLAGAARTDRGFRSH